MDASILNGCEYQILSVIKEVARIFDTKITVDTEPIAEGGIKQWLRVISREENKKSPIISAIVIALVSGVLLAPISKISEKLIDNIFEDTDLKNLEKEKIKLEIARLRQEINIDDNAINDNTLIKKRKSNFYEYLSKYPKVEKVSFSIVDDRKNKIIGERFIYKRDFKDFIIDNNSLEPIENENAIIEIISPVLKKGKYKWMGIYNGVAVPFTMSSNEFKILVQSGIVEFKNGSSIDCYLEIKREIDNEGTEKIISYDVKRVNKYFQNNQPIETSEGKTYRNKIEAAKNQLKLDLE